MNYFTTLSKTINIKGKGLHTGVLVSVVIEPQPPGIGIIFVRSDLPGRPVIRADAMHRGSTKLCTEIKAKNGAYVMTIEHLMAAFAALGITDAKIYVDGPELPALDGSSKLFFDALSKAIPARSNKSFQPIQIKERIQVSCEESYAFVEPCNGLKITVELDFPQPLIGRSKYSLLVNPLSFAQNLASARTFAMFEDVERIKAAGLGKGGNLENTVVLNKNRVMNPEGLRFSDEFARHKALDALGDLYLLGLPLEGHYYAYRPGHTLNASMVDAILHTQEKTSFNF